MNPIRETARRRLAVAGVVALAVTAAVGVRLVDLAVVQHGRWVTEAERQHERTVRLDPERGTIFDREGRELAISVAAWSAFADPSALPLAGERDVAARRLAAALDVPVDRIRRRLERDGYFAWLERKLDAARAARVEALGIPGVGFVKESRRVYPGGELAAHVLGAVGTDNHGLEGLEHAMDRIVAGRPGRLLTMRDARGGEFLPQGVSRQAPTRGADVTLTLDSVVQHVAERELRRAVARTGAKAGSVIVMFPGNGDVVALSNHPTFNPNNFPTYPSHLRTNRAVASCYEPGSTLKLFTAAAALESGRVRPGDLIDCGRGSIRIGRTRIRDHHSYDQLVVEDVLALSSNVGAVRLAQEAGAPTLHRVLRAFGFGAPTDVGVPGESAGILRDVEDWSPLSLASVAFGQEVAVSPLQLATAACAVASGGVLRRPRLVRSIRHADGHVEATPADPGHRAISQETARTVARMLEAVVERGTARQAAVPGYRVAGKTGTAQKVGPEGRYLQDAHVASFVGWVPARDPAFVALVVLDEPVHPYHGGTAAAPAFAALARDVLRYLEIPAEDPANVLRTGGGGGVGAS